MVDKKVFLHDENFLKQNNFFMIYDRSFKYIETKATRRYISYKADLSSLLSFFKQKKVI